MFFRASTEAQLHSTLLRSGYFFQHGLICKVWFSSVSVFISNIYCKMSMGIPEAWHQSKPGVKGSNTVKSLNGPKSCFFIASWANRNRSRLSNWHDGWQLTPVMTCHAKASGKWRKSLQHHFCLTFNEGTVVQSSDATATTAASAW